MDFLEWLADELRKTDDEEIEIGFDEDTEDVTLAEIVKEKENETIK